ncbi:hypothetical protein MN608_06719 [Microdochium nivale]|nr:hypothetical protein MN608_06719 [Microdochium nivale]
MAEEKTLCLLSLPAEIRLMIYDVTVRSFVNHAARPIEVIQSLGADNELTMSKGDRRKTRTIPLLLTCKTVAAELSPLLCQNCSLQPREFMVFGKEPDGLSGGMLRTIYPRAPTRGLRHVRLVWQKYEDIGSGPGHSGNLSGAVVSLLGGSRETIRSVEMAVELIEGRRLTHLQRERTPMRVLSPRRQEPWDGYDAAFWWAAEKDMWATVEHCAGLPRLKSVSFTGVFRQKWLDLAESRLCEVRVHRGYPFVPVRGGPLSLFVDEISPPGEEGEAYEICE